MPKQVANYKVQVFDFLLVKSYEKSVAKICRNLNQWNQGKI